ncbi:MAG: porin [Usitatibacter sp.]
MQKKALVLALGAALMIPSAAYAQKSKDKPEADSVVELYGKVYPELIFPSSKGATSVGTPLCTICGSARPSTFVSRTELDSSNSRFGIRGHEKLAPGLKAIFQLETQFLVDQNTTTFATRDSFVGLASGWGTVKLGRMDTPFKDYGDDVSFLGVSSGNITSTSNVYRHVGFGTQNRAARFHERAINVVQYESPHLGPFEWKSQYSAGENDTTSPPRRPHWWSHGGKLEFGNFEILAGYEQHLDFFGLSANAPTAMRNTTDPNVRSKDEAFEVALKLKVGKHQFEIDANKKRYRENGATVTGRVQEYKNTAYMFLYDVRLSPQWRLAFHYVKAKQGTCARVNAVCNTDGLDGSQTSLGVAYHFSRRTYLFLMGAFIKNGYSAVYNSAAQGIAPGEDVRQIAAGIHTAF